jgi:UDP:flavonoid glycosyltransferase YjiC (YdhE family)
VRILAFTTAGSGHFLPMVPVLKALNDAGHEVAISAPAQFEGSVISAGLSPRFSRPDIPPDRLGSVFARIEGLSNEASNRIYMRDVFGALNLEAGLDAARAAIAESTPDVVVAEEAEVTSRVAAAEAGIRRANATGSGRPTSASSRRLRAGSGASVR